MTALVARRARAAPDRRRGAGASRGFTLIELLIALAILALVSVLGYRAVSSLGESEVRLTAEAQRWRGLDALFARLEADLRAAQPRAVRTGAGTEAALLGTVDERGDADLRLSRAGAEFAVGPGAAGQRLRYRLREGAIEVLYLPHLDQPATLVPTAYALAADIARFRIGYLDAGGAWRDRWPALGEAPVPRAVRVEITLAGGDVVERWMALR